MRTALFEVACVALPKAAGGVLTVVLNAALLGFMSPAEFGVYALCLTFVTLADGVLGAAVDMAAVKLASACRVADPARAAAFERWALVIKLGFVVLVGVAVAPLLAPLSSGLFHREDPTLLALALGVAALVMGVRSVSLHLQLARRFVAYAGVETLAQLLRVSGIVAVMLWWQPSAFALVLASLFGAAVTLVGGLGMAGLRRARFTLPREVGREMRRTVGWMLLTFAFSSVLARIDVLLIARWSTIEQVGLFGAAQVFAVIPEMLGLWLAVVFSPRVAPARAQGRLRATMMRIQLALALLVALLALVAWLGVAMAPRFMPSQFVAASPLLLPLLLGAFSGLLLMPFTVPALIFASPRFIFVLDLVTLPLLLFAYHWAIAHSGAVGAAWVSGAGRSIKAVIIQLAAWYRAAPEAPVSSSPSP